MSSATAPHGKPRQASRQCGENSLKCRPRSSLVHNVTQPGKGTSAPNWSWIPREMVLACRYDQSWPSGPIREFDSPSGNPTLGASSCQSARPFQKSSSVGGAACGVREAVGLASAAGTGLGHKNVAVGDGVIVGLPVGSGVGVGSGMLVDGPLTVGVGVMDGTSLGDGLAVAVRTDVGGGGVSVI